MAIKIGQVVLFLTADASPLEKTLDGAKTTTTNWAASLGSSVATLVGGAVVAGAAAAAGAVLGIGAAALSTASKFDQVSRDMQAQLGLTEDEANRLGDVVRTVYGDNFAGTIEEAGQRVTDVMRSLGSEADKLSDEELARLTEQVVALSDAFGVDLNESMRSASILVRTGVAKDFDDAMNIITAGFQNGLDVSGDFLDTLSEYADDFADMGLTGPQVLGMINRGLEAGAFNADKLGDAINEFGIRLRDPTIGDKVREIDTDIAALYDEFQSGAITEGEALDGMLKRIAAIEDPIKRDAAGVALFGSMWEDLGEDPILAMAGLEEGTIAVDEATERLNAQYANWKNMWESIKHKALLALEPLGEKLLEIANQIMPYVEMAFDWIKEQAPIWLEKFRAWWADKIAPALEKVTNWWNETGQEAFGSLKQAIIDLFSGDTESAWNNLMNAIDLIFGEGTSEKIEDLKNDIEVFKANVVLKLNEIWDEVQLWWTKNIQPTWDEVSNYLRYELPDALAVFRANVVLELNTIWDEVQIWWYKNVKPLLDESKAWFEEDGPAAMAPYVAAWKVLEATAKGVAAVFKDSVWPPIRDALKDLGEAFGATGVDVDKFGKKLDILGTVITVVTGTILALTVGPLVLLASALAGLATGAANAFEAIVGTFIELGTSLEMILDGIVDLFTGLFDIVKGIITGDGELVQEGWSLLWTGLWEIISGTFETITTFLIGTVASLLELGTGFIEGFAGLFVELFDGLGIDVPNWLNELVEMFRNIDWWGLGKELIDGIKNGFTEGFTGWKDNIGNPINDFVNSLKGEAEIESPSGLTEREIGEPLAQGVLKGFSQRIADTKEQEVLSTSINRLGQQVNWYTDRYADAEKANTDAIIAARKKAFEAIQGEIDEQMAADNQRQLEKAFAGTSSRAEEGGGITWQGDLVVYADGQTNGQEVGEKAGSTFLDYVGKKGGQT